MIFQIKKGEDANAATQSGSGRPEFIQKPLIRQLEDKILFECRLRANPVPSFVWYLDKNVLKNPSKYKQRFHLFFY